MTTAYHSQYLAHVLTLKQASGSIDNISRSIANARVDLNPHQVEAALFSLRSPLSNGAILADEVGLGKTIEAGIVLSQYWAERHRKILIIVPAALRKQWQQELLEKFFLPSTILDGPVFRRLVTNGQPNPFDQQDQIVICSYHFASAKRAELSRIPWDCVCIDEAHRLRNVYRSSSKLARNIADAIGSVPKLLLTATPLQNSLMELYGLVSIIDDHVFGDATTFRETFVRAANEKKRNAALRQRIAPICSRTLRKQVTEYIPFTRRVPITQEFSPSNDEHRLYNMVSAYLQRDRLIALPASQRTLITLVLRKLLASSTFAISGTLRRLVERLENLSETYDLLGEDDLEDIDELQDEWTSDEEEQENSATNDIPFDPKLLKEELAELRNFANLAESVTVNAKGEALIPALNAALDQSEQLGAQRKALIFTESRRTQQYLYDLLSANGYKDRLVLMNGSNNDPTSKEVYQQWLQQHQDDDQITGSRGVDVKAAIVEHFKNHATILIATEAGAEGINLQFCSLVVNYDLPWNPMRVEQRIGRCHRYGQKHDVVVVNFLNKRNAADQRVFQLLSEKFNLFDGVFGSSDEVLGALESGVDIERRIASVYQSCRTPEEITAAFDALQAELDEQIQNRMENTRQTLLEHFDEDVSDRLRVNRDRTLESLSEREQWLLMLTRIELDGQAEFDDSQPRFRYTGPHAKTGDYHLDWKQAETNGDHFYRPDHSLALRVIDQAITRNLPTAQIIFDYTGSGSVISILKPFVGKSGWLELSKLTVDSFETEEYLIFAAQSDDGQTLDAEMCRKLLLLPATLDSDEPAAAMPNLTELRQQDVDQHIKQVEQRNVKFFDEEVIKLDRWSDDLKNGLERQIKEIDKEIREARKAAALAQSLQTKLEGQKQIKALESNRNRKRRELFEAQDAIDVQRDELIGKIETQMQQRCRIKSIFNVKWRLL